MTRRTLELLERLTAGEKMPPDELDDMLHNQVSEDLFLEYKHGDELNKKKPGATIRQYLSGFANSDGGNLIVGVDEGTWSVTGCTAPGGGDLAEWASRCLTPIASRFSPPPRFQVVEHPKGDVLVASTERSLNLIPCIESGQLVYYLRIHNQTLKAPDFLVSDILLGKRQRPYLHITDFYLNMLDRRLSSDSGAMDLRFSTVLACENQSLAWAGSVRLGIVSWVNAGFGPRSPLSNHLLWHIEIRDRQKHSGKCKLIHLVNPFSEMEPFDFVQTGDFYQEIPLRVHSDWYVPYTWQAAAYVLSRESPPIWYQITVEVDSPLLQLMSNGESSVSGSGLLGIRRLSGERPVVAWNGLE